MAQDPSDSFSSELLEVLIAFRNGDFSRRMPADQLGLGGKIADTLNEIMEIETTLLTEYRQLAEAVGHGGRTSHRINLPRFGRGWTLKVDFVNGLVGDLVRPLNEMARVIGAVARGDLNQKVAEETDGRPLRGEFLRTALEVNGMVAQLSRFASEVTRVAREVGTEVTAGNLSRFITVQAEGEVAVLKDNINEMIRNLRETTIRATEQDWLQTNLAKFTCMLQGQRDHLTVANQVLSELAPLVCAHHGVFYLAGREGEDPSLHLLASYAFQDRKDPRNVIRLGEGLVGQAALEKVRIIINDVPSDYVQIESGLGRARPLNLVVLPVVFEGRVNAVVELASFNRFSPVHLAFLEQLTESIGIILNTITATLRKEELLSKSQALAQELQSQQEEMSETNKRLEAQALTLTQSQCKLESQQQDLQRAYLELEERARLVSNQKTEVEAARAALQSRTEQQQQDLKLAHAALEERVSLVAAQKVEVDATRSALQEKAEQLSQASKYKSEFLANMSHDLRTPLNSLLILSRALEENREGNLTPRQVEYASTIYAAGQDLLELINDVLDLSKIESGTLGVELTEVSFRALLQFAERTFRPLAEGKGLAFEVRLDPSLPPVLRTDSRQLQQVIRNFLSNAFKFTERGSVTLEVAPAHRGWTPGHPTLDPAPRVLAFAVRDTGIGIDPSKHRLIFEAFQQADGSTSRKYGGTGLGLSISRGIATMLGGEITLQSHPGQGSTFTFFMPLAGAPEAPSRGHGGALEEAFRRIPALASSRPRRLLVVEDDPVHLMAVREILDDAELVTAAARTGREALEALRKDPFDCVVLDLNLPDMTGLELLRRLREEGGTRRLPVIIHTARNLTRREEAELRHLAETIIVKDPRSPGKIFDETALFLNRAEAPVPGVHIDGVEARHRLRGRKVLLVDDDARNIFALSTVLEEQGMHIVPAATGLEALQALADHPEVDLVLMDVMLPGMDGFQTTRAIRAREVHARLPIIALTAKAMRGDRELCLEAGASDYVPKPVDTGRLLAAMEAQLTSASSAPPCA